MGTWGYWGLEVRPNKDIPKTQNFYIVLVSVNKNNIFKKNSF